MISHTSLQLIIALDYMECEERMRPLWSVTRGESSWGMAMSIVVGKSVVYVGFYALFSVFLLGLLPLLYDLPHLAHPLLLVQWLTPYLLASAFFGLACMPFFKDSDAPLLFIAFFSVGLLFLSGVSWPLELMPWPWRLLHALLPAPVGALAFVKVNCMGADLADISREMMLLWGQCVVYFGMSVWGYKKLVTLNDRNNIQSDKLKD